jgi:hypothetical protein
MFHSHFSLLGRDDFIFHAGSSNGFLGPADLVASGAALSIEASKPELQVLRKSGKDFSWTKNTLRKSSAAQDSRTLQAGITGHEKAMA